MTNMVVTVTAAGVSIAPATEPGSPIAVRPTLLFTLGGVDRWLAGAGYRRSGADWDITVRAVAGLHISAVVVPVESAAEARHTCNGGAGPHWGRRTRGCPRCAALEAGAEPVRWAGSHRAAPTSHHRCDSRCGRVCTGGDW